MDEIKTLSPEFPEKRKNKKETAFASALKAAERYNPDFSAGLNAEQTASRRAAGLNNIDTAIKTKSSLKIFIDNICTFFNLIWSVIFAALALVGAWGHMLFMVIVLLNTGIGIFQELRSKRTLDKLSLLGAEAVTVVRGGEKIKVIKSDILLDDIMVLDAGRQIPADCILVHGSAEVNESILTGESAAVQKEEGDAMFAGSFISSGLCYARADKIGPENYIQTLMAYAKTFKSNKSVLLLSLSKLVRIIGFCLIPMAVALAYVNYLSFGDDLYNIITKTSGAITGMIPAGMYLLVSIALASSVIKLSANKVWVKELYSIEMLARVNVLCLDKTGTITDGDMRVKEVITLSEKDGGAEEIMAALLAATNDKNTTAEALKRYFRARTEQGAAGANAAEFTVTDVMPFSSERKMSGASFKGLGTYVFGAPEFVKKDMGKALADMVASRAKEGLRVTLLGRTSEKLGAKKFKKVKPVALIALEDHIREDAAATIKWFTENDVAVKVISGDNPVTVAAVAKKAGVAGAEKFISLEGLSERETVEVANLYTVFGRVSPEQKRILVKAIKAAGNTVAMTGDGVNDILALKESDCAIAMAGGSEAARNVSHMALMDDNFAKMPLVVKNGRRVINNIQATTSIFLMKTFLSAALSVFIIAAYRWLNMPYPLTPRDLLIIEFAVIGVPPFLLAFQPSEKRIEGRFLPNVFKKTLPLGITLLCSYLALLIYSKNVNISSDAYATMTILTVTLVGWSMLLVSCLPLNGYRALVCGGSLAVILFLAFVLPSFFGITPLAPTEVLFTTAVVLAAPYLALGARMLLERRM